MKKDHAQDGAQLERLQEPEVVWPREARAIDAVVDHGEVERRHEEVCCHLPLGAGLKDQRVADRLGLYRQHRRRSLRRLDLRPLAHIKEGTDILSDSRFQNLERLL